jgi:hypothetical protein
LKAKINLVDFYFQECGADGFIVIFRQLFNFAIPSVAVCDFLHCTTIKLPLDKWQFLPFPAPRVSKISVSKEKDRFIKL